MDINNNIEKMGFGEPYSPKPTINTIQDFFDKRLKLTDERVGISISNDNLGNKVYSSLNKTEGTFAGEVKASLVATEEGIAIVARNHGLLKQIYTGNITPKSNSLGGFESHVYRIELETAEGQKDFALKYAFPVSAEGDDDDETSYTHTSGIIAMRIMQMAEREKPVPYVKYISPVLATHDITLAPFIAEGIHTEDVISYLQYPNDELGIEEFEGKYNFTPEQLNVLHEMLQYEGKAKESHGFYLELQKVLINNDEKLAKWVDDKVSSIGEFSSFQYSSGDTGLSQSVVSLEDLLHVFNRFKSDNNFSADNPEFSKAVLSSLALVELGNSTVDSSSQSD